MYLFFFVCTFITQAQEEKDLVTLTDSDFEHLTQVATGATTGDWFVLFHKGDAECCKKWLEAWEKLAVLVKQENELQLSIAKIDGIANPEVVKRFGVKMPTAIYFRLGKMYRVTVKPDAEDLLKFIKSSRYRFSPPESVPKQLTFFSDFSESVPPYVIAAASVGVLILVFILKTLLTSNSSKTQVAETQPKPQETESKSSDVAPQNPTQQAPNLSQKAPNKTQPNPSKSKRSKKTN